ncbi:MAG: phosphoribosyltransferase [Gammaproteobacteria bacterium]|nr:phosphoribosyltransferase [Gammaproteobacteria bacterium]
MGAQALYIPSELVMGRKLRLPNEPDQAIGAITSGGHTLLDESAIASLGVTEVQLQEVERRTREEMQRREQAYRGDSPDPTLTGHTVILVDDGMNSGASMQVAVAGLAQQNPAAIVVAVPVASMASVAALKHVDKLICLHQPKDLVDIASCYESFEPVSEDEVRDLLARSLHLALRDVDIPPFT